MPRIVKSTIIDAPCDRVWEVLRDFNGHDRWHPAVATSTIERGQSRGQDRLRAAVQARRTARSCASNCWRSPISSRASAIACSTRRSRCSIMSPMSVCCRSPTATAPSGTGSRASRRAPGDEARLTEMVGEQIYQAGFEAIRKRLREAV